MILMIKRIVRYLNLNGLRTYLSNYEVFLPVSSFRWNRAQLAEARSWQLPSKLLNAKADDYLGNEQIKARFIMKHAEKVLDRKFSDIFRDKIVLDIACGPGSIIAEERSPLKKIGVDPASFPKWVHDRYQSQSFELVSAPLETASLETIIEEDCVVIMYNALQHFRNCNQALRNLRNQIKSHTLIIVDYANVPADLLHPQILSFRRIERWLERNGYIIEDLNLGMARLEGLVELPNENPIGIISCIARTKNSY